MGIAEHVVKLTGFKGADESRETSSRRMIIAYTVGPDFAWKPVSSFVS